jgi:hypothetical protein
MNRDFTFTDRTDEHNIHSAVFPEQQEYRHFVLTSEQLHQLLYVLLTEFPK